MTQHSVISIDIKSKGSQMVSDTCCPGMAVQTDGQTEEQPATNLLRVWAESWSTIASAVITMTIVPEEGMGKTKHDK